MQRPVTKATRPSTVIDLRWSRASQPSGSSRRGGLKHRTSPPAARSGAARSRRRSAAASPASRRGRGPSCRLARPGHQRLAEPPPDLIVVDDVHLEVDRAPRPLDCRQPGRVVLSASRKTRRRLPGTAGPRQFAETPARRIGDADPPSGWPRPACAGGAASSYRGPAANRRLERALHHP